MSMIQDIIYIDNVFENPDSIVELASKQQYFLSNENPTTKNTKISYSGIRTLPLNNILAADEYYNLTNQIFKKIFANCVSLDITAQTTCLFHSLTSENIPNISWKHKDTSLYSGVVYLNKNFIDRFNNHGTKIYKNNEEINTKYEFNKLVLYRGEYLHSPNFGFGETLLDSRLTLNFFINDMSISTKNTNQLDLYWHNYCL